MKHERESLQLKMLQSCKVLMWSLVLKAYAHLLFQCIRAPVTAIRTTASRESSATPAPDSTGETERVCVCKREREREMCVSERVYMCVRERVCVCVCASDSVCMGEFVCM